MAELLAELVAKITADATELKKGLGEATDDIQSWVKQNGAQFKAVGAALTGVGAAVTGSLGMMTKAAIDEEVNIKRLGIALKGVGVNYDDVKDNLEATMKATQTKTGIADDEQRDVLGRLILVTKDYDKALALLPMALDLAAAGQMDATTAATYLAKGNEELENGAEEIGIRLGQATVKFKDLNEVQKLVGGTAEATANPFNILKASMGDLAEKIGSFLIPILKDIVAKVVPIIEGVQKWTDAHPGLTKVLVILAAVLGGVALVLGPILIMLPMLVAGFALLTGPVGLAIAALMGLIAVGTLIILNWEKIKAKAVEIWEGIKSFFLGIWEAIRDIFIENLDKILLVLAIGPLSLIAIPLLIIRNWEKIKDFFLGLWESIVSGLKSAWESIVNFILENVNWLINAINSVIELINKIPGINIEPIGSISVPKLASGGIITQPTLAMVGESGAEAIIPLSEMENKTIQNNLYLDGALFAQIVSKYFDREYRAQLS